MGDAGCQTLETAGDALLADELPGTHCYSYCQGFPGLGEGDVPGRTVHLGTLGGYDIGGLPVEACKTFNLPLGCVIALAELVDIEVITPDNIPPEPERAFGNYTPGRYMWVFDQVQELSKALSASGALRLWQWHPPQVCQEELDALLQQMKRDQHDSHTTTL